jgi:hypothetical protein
MSGTLGTERLWQLYQRLKATAMRVNTLILRPQFCGLN